MIAAVAQNGIIGKDNDLVWNLPDDMKYFMQTTSGHPIIMGRKNYESIPDKFRPLPNRTNIIVTRNIDYLAEGAIVVNSLEDALESARETGSPEVFIIGGGEIYSIGFPYADKLYLTEIEGIYDGDTFFPEFDRDEWKETSRIHHSTDDRHETAFDFVVYDRIPAE